MSVGFLGRLSVFRPIFRNFSKENIISSKINEIQIPKTSLHEFLWGNLSRWPDKTATVCFETKRSYTYHELYKKSLSITRFLLNSLKLNRRDTVAVILPNVPEYPAVVIGASQAGLRITTCNPNYTAEEIRKQLIDSESKLVFTVRELLPVVRQATNLPVVEISNNNDFSNGTISFNEIASGEPGQPVRDVSFDEIVILPYSSGTTGLPKGVQLTHFNLVSNLCQISADQFLLLNASPGDEQDLVPCILPFFHIYGLVVLMLHGLTQGAKLVTMPKFTSDNFVHLVKNYKVDVLYCVPLVVVLATNHRNIKTKDLVGIRTVMSGAAPLGASDVERFRTKTNNQVGIIQGYGMTETSPVTIMQSQSLENGVKIGGSGLLLPNTRAKIIPIDGPSTQSLGPNQSGELIVKGPQIMAGYYNNPEADRDIFLGDGWLRSGDIGYYDEDAHFYITDRLKELIKVKGFQVPPAEIEAVLRSHPSVDDAGVVGIPHPTLGEAPKAFVVVKPGQNLKTNELEEFVASKVAKHKHLAGGVVLVDAIPKNPSGKILRKELRKMI